MSDTEWQSESQAPVVPEKATQGAETQRRDWSWVEAAVWNERMLAALGNGVRGGKWFSLIDKVYRQQTLQAAWPLDEDWHTWRPPAGWDDPLDLPDHLRPEE